MNRFLMICAASLSLCALSNAQPIVPPDVQRGVADPAPSIDEKAERFVEQMVRRAPARVEAFAALTELKFPIYFDETGRNNALARKFGVKGWASTFIFGADGKLKFIGGRVGTVESIAAIQKLLPNVNADDLTLQTGEYVEAE